MNLINEEFCNSRPNLFLTENVSLFLYSLIRCTRPQNILEMGAGYSTAFISRAIEDVKKENLQFFNENFNQQFLIVNNKRYYGSGYNPVFDVIESFYTEEYYNEVIFNLRKDGLEKNVNFIDQSFENYLKETKKKYDLIWMDLGTGREYMYFFKLFLNVINDGGYIIIHNTLTNLTGRLFISEVKMMAHFDNSLEVINIFEPHKNHQNSFTIIKKTLEYPIYRDFA